jgi:hypothetical protein
MRASQRSDLGTVKRSDVQIGALEAARAMLGTETEMNRWPGSPPG